MEYNYVTKEMCLEVKDRKINLELLSPQENQLAQDPILLMTFAADRHTSLKTHPFCIQTEMFLEMGHRVLSFDLPNHGERINEYGSEITGLRNSFIHGCDPFEMYVEDAIATVDYCIEHAYARPGRIVVGGTSRAGYMVLRHLAADDRICAAAAFAPVTDWRYLDEFSGDRERKDVADLTLSCYCEKLGGKKIFIAIGNHDKRVSTASCCRFYLDLLDTNVPDGADSMLIDFYCTNDEDHTLSDFWKKLGGLFLLRT